MGRPPDTHRGGEARRGEGLAVRHFPNRPSSIPAVRRYVRDALGGVGEDLTARAELAVSELATNALRHGGGDVRVGVRCDDSEIRIEVADASPAPPRPRTPPPDDPGGRGMLVVDAVADAWGVELVAGGTGGKVVWFVLHRRHRDGHDPGRARRRPR